MEFMPWSRTSLTHSSRPIFSSITASTTCVNAATLASISSGMTISGMRSSPSAEAECFILNSFTPPIKLALAARTLELHNIIKKHSGKLAPLELDRVDRDIASTDAEIDELVYQLYGITDEERGIIEGVT